MSDTAQGHGLPLWLFRYATVPSASSLRFPIPSLLAADEYNFDDLSPPVHAYAVWRVFQITRRVTGVPDLPFLERTFHKLLLNFSFWANRKDPQGNSLFSGGFLGLDNIGVRTIGRGDALLGRGCSASVKGLVGIPHETSSHSTSPLRCAQVFDRSTLEGLPHGASIQQADATAWMVRAGGRTDAVL